jgi:hypothetical protein
MAGSTVTLNGIGRIENVPDWERTTGEYFRDMYDGERSGGMRDIAVEVTVTGVVGVKVMGARGGSGPPTIAHRSLRSEDRAVIVAYSQETWHSTDGLNRDPDDDFVVIPSSTESRRDEYVGRLKSLSGYEHLADVSETSVTSSNCNEVNGGEFSDQLTNVSVIPVTSSDADKVCGDEQDSSDGVANAGVIIEIIFGTAVCLTAIVFGIVHYIKVHYDGDINNTDEGRCQVDVRTASVSSREGTTQTVG